MQQKTEGIPGTLRILHRARARTGAFGANVYPLEAYGLLLGLPDDTGVPALAVAPLLVGKTLHWHSADGRFDRIDEAAVVAGEAFAPFGLQPIGLFCTCSGHEESHPSGIEHTAPRRADLPWLLLRSLGGGDTMWTPWAMRLSGKTWQDVELLTDRSSRCDPRFNLRRLHSMWLRAWNVPDYGNNHETGLARPGLACNNQDGGAGA